MDEGLDNSSLSNDASFCFGSTSVHGRELNVVNGVCRASACATAATMSSPHGGGGEVLLCTNILATAHRDGAWATDGRHHLSSRQCGSFCSELMSNIVVGVRRVRVGAVAVAILYLVGEEIEGAGVGSW